MSSPQDPKGQHKFYQTQNFKALDAEWRQKLKEDGFEDAEDNRNNLKEYASSDFQKRPEYDQSKEEYYRLAGHFLHEYHFRDSRSGAWEWKKRIWELHADGKSIREIIKILDPEGKEPFGTAFKKVQTNLARLAKAMVKRAIKSV